jgi:hypothetical protein
MLKPLEMVVVAVVVPKATLPSDAREKSAKVEVAKVTGEEEAM